MKEDIVRFLMNSVGAIVGKYLRR